jgi:ParB/RepB/Spo0J family partition protein
MPDIQTVTRNLPLDQVDEPEQPVRSSFDEPEFFALVDSMRIVGQLQPIIVRPRHGRYETVAGHRRLKAARYLRWVTIQATIQEANEEQVSTVRAHENAFREPIQPEDEGHFFQGLAQSLKWGVREIAKNMNRSPYYIESRLKTLTWPADVRDALRNGIIGIGAAEAFAEIGDVAERQRLLGYAKSGGINARTARAWADAWAISHSQIDAALIQANASAPAQRWEEPMYPCYGCERPVVISRLTVIRLCEDCNHEMSTAIGRAPDNRPDTQATDRETRAPGPPKPIPPQGTSRGDLQINPPTTPRAED